MPRVRQIVTLLALAACGRSSGTVTVGAAGPWTQGYGAMNKRGMDLAVEEINAAGGVGGRPFRVVVRDDAGDGAKAAQIAAEFVADPEISAVIGHVNSGAMVAAARVYDGHLAAVATTATSPDVSGLSSWVFRVISSDSVNGRDIARFAGRLGRKRAAILYENNSYGRGLAESFQRDFKGEVVSVDPIGEDGENLEPFVSYYARANPDIVFVAGTDRSGMRLLREARRQRVKADFIGGDGWTGVVVDTASSEGAYVGAPFSDKDPRPEAQRFVAAFRTKYHATPDGNAALAYDATRLVAQAIAERGTRREDVRDYLAGLTEQRPFAGVTGPISFRETGDVVGKGFVMTRIHAGGLDVEKTQ